MLIAALRGTSVNIIHNTLPPIFSCEWGEIVVITTPHNSRPVQILQKSAYVLPKDLIR